MSSKRLLEIAATRLASAQAMRALSHRQTEVLFAIDAAARGEMGQGEAEEVLHAHLAARESCLTSMRSFDQEWRILTDLASATRGDESEEFKTAAKRFVELLAEIEAADAAFVGELSSRRRTARTEIARADSGRAAHRAYAPSRAENPRFTDRRG